MLAIDSETWIRNNFAAGVNPPFSFNYVGQSSSELSYQWEFSSTETDLDAQRIFFTFVHTDPSTHLQITSECILNHEYDAVEWVCYFKNCGKEDTPLIENIQAADCLLARQEIGQFILHHALGSNAMRIDFAPDEEPLDFGVPVTLETVGGRSSDSAALPFFNLEAVGEGGLMIAVGWSGQWVASFSLETPETVRFRAGMELTRFVLHAGEQVRTPRILIMPWTGPDSLRGHNLFRQLLLHYYVPQREGEPVQLPLAFSGCPGQKLGEEANNYTEESQIEWADAFVPYGFEYHWIDAGWFKGRWPNGVGSWFIRDDGFPRGLRPISDHAKANGMGFILWFEPERVHDGTWLDCEHPEWRLQLPGNPDKLFNLGNPAAVQWLTDHISNLIETQGIAIYRHDFNIRPLPFWRAFDEPDRQGMTEIRYIEGFYAYWDALLVRHPGLIIDNCASGGRRIDLETMSRSVPLWRTDYQYFEPNGQQCHTWGLSFYVPTGATADKIPDAYHMRSAYSNGMVVNWDPFLPDFPAEDAKRFADEFRRARPFFYGDYYPLTPYEMTDNAWMAYQFHRPDLQQGIVLGFRRQNARDESIVVKLGGLNPASQYTLENADTGAVETRSGKELSNGLTITTEDAPQSILLFYSQEV